jgi:FMN-dependent NADH-azoreductase
MKKILHIISSPRGAASDSIRLGNAVVEKLVAANPDSTVKLVNLVKQQIPHLEELHLSSFFTPADQHTDNLRDAIRYSDDAISDLKESDIIVIGAPMYNFTIHSSLKAWIDHISRSGQTFAVGPNGAEGLIKGKKVYVVVSSGWVYSEGPMKPMDFITGYLTTMLGFMGMTDITFIRAEGVMIPELKENALTDAINNIKLN